MVRRNKVNLIQFYNLYWIKELNKEAIMVYFDISPKTFQKYIKLTKEMKFEITTDFLERNCMINYHIAEEDKDKAKIMDQLIMLWRHKHKVPDSNEDDQIIQIGVTEDNFTQ